jgi:GNAT superfamily N-acetyltransferase
MALQLKYARAPDTGLREAIRLGDIRLATYFLDQGASPTGIFRGKTNLMRVIDGSRSSELLLSLLIRRGARPTIETMKYAIAKGNFDAVRLLSTKITITDYLLRYAMARKSKPVIVEFIQKRVVPPQLQRINKIQCTNPFIERYDTSTMDLFNAEVAEVAIHELGKCKYADKLEQDLQESSADAFFFAFDGVTEECIAGASVVLDTLSLGFYIRYLCSAKKCDGAGSFLVHAMEEAAKREGYKHVGLYSDKNAVEFYRKMGYVRGNSTKKITTRSEFSSRPFVKNL